MFSFDTGCMTRLLIGEHINNWKYYNHSIFYIGVPELKTQVIGRFGADASKAVYPAFYHCQDLKKSHTETILH